jgi:hypothetical protein
MTIVRWSLFVELDAIKPPGRRRHRPSQGCLREDVLELRAPKTKLEPKQVAITQC